MVYQAGRRGHTGLHRETEAVGLTRAVVGVLSENNNLYLVEGSPVQGVEDLASRGKEGFALSFFLYKKLPQLIHVGLFKLIMQNIQPLGIQFDFAGHSPSLSMISIIEKFPAPRNPPV